jgi:hypothetical protein
VGDPWVGGDDEMVLQGAGGETWAIWSRGGDLPLAYMMKQGDRWTPAQAILPVGWEFVDHLAGVLDGAGKPVIVWTAFDGTPGMAVAAARWTGTAWSSPVILDRLETSTSVNHLVAQTDDKGHVHVVYDRPLHPPEEYSRGIGIVEGEYPDKCFHVTFDGTQWSTAQATTGPGRFAIDPSALSTAPGGHLFLAMGISPLGRIANEPWYVGGQTWDGTKWLPIERLTPKTDLMQGRGGAMLDRWGGRITWWQDPAGGIKATGADVSTATSAQIVDVGYSYEFKRNPGGWVGVYWRDDPVGYYTLWDGKKWLVPLKCVIATHAFPGANGNILLTQRKAGTILVQEIRTR